MHIAARLEPYRKMQDALRALPLLVVCRTPAAQANFQNAGAGLPILLTTADQARFGPLTGASTVWSRNGAAVALLCPKRD